MTRNLNSFSSERDVGSEQEKPILQWQNAIKVQLDKIKMATTKTGVVRSIA